jgi:hypothetical protein
LVLGELRMKYEPIVVSLVFTLVYASTFSHFLNGFIHDEFRLLNVVKGIQEYGVPSFLGRNYYQHPPLVYLAVVVPSSVIPVDIAAMLVELLCAFGTLYLFYLLANLVIGRKAALLGTVILGTHPNIWIWSNRFLHEAPLLLFFTASLYLFTVAMRTNKRLHWLLLGVLLGLGLNLKVSTMLVVPIVVAHMLLSNRLVKFSKGVKLDLNGMKSLLAVGMVAICVYTPYLVYTHINNAPSQTQIFSREIAGAAAFSLPEPWYFYIVNFPDFVNIAVLPFFFYGLLAASIRKDRKMLTYLVWFLIPVVFFTLPSYKSYRYLNPLFPVFVLFTAYGMSVHPRSLMATLKKRRVRKSRREFSCMKRNATRIQEAYNFLWSLRERSVSWGTVSDLLGEARRTGVSTALFVKSMSTSEEKFVTNTTPELEIDLNKELHEIVAELKGKMKGMGTKTKKKRGEYGLVQIALTLLIASFGAYQSLSVVLYDGEWPSGYDAWNTLNALDSNGGAASFFTNKFVEYLSTTDHDYDVIGKYNAQYILADPDWVYIEGNPIFKPVEFLPELNSTLYSVNWTGLGGVSSYIPFEISVNPDEGGLEAVWLFIEYFDMGRTTSEGVYKGFLPDNITVEIGLHHLCYAPETLYIRIENGVVYNCLNMWLQCGLVDAIEVNMDRRSCLYHPEFVLDRF